MKLYYHNEITDRKDMSHPTMKRKSSAQLELENFELEKDLPAKPRPKVLLSIAGFDPSSGAGSLADVGVFRRLGFAGAAILTSVTAQNSRKVEEFIPLSPRFLAKQYETLICDLPIFGLKVGMIGSRKNLPVLSRILEEQAKIPRVADPVFRSSSGFWLLEEDAVPAYIRAIKGKLAVLTPNLTEAALISRLPVRNLNEMKRAAEIITSLIDAPCLIKGGHLAAKAVDVLFDGRRFRLFEKEKIRADVHGTGCLLSASLTCFLAQGHPLARACELASRWTRRAIRTAVRIGKGRAIASFHL